MVTKVQSKAGVVARAQALIAGANKHFANATQVTIAGQSLTLAQIVEKLQALVDLRTAVDAAKASTQAKLAAEQAQAPSLRTFMGAFVMSVKAAHHNSPDVLADFGIHPKSPTTQTVETKTAAVAKRASTRAARHTVGSKQRLAIKGDVTGVTLTPIVATPPAATPPTTAPASDPSTPAKSGSATVPPASPHTP
jgi:hypothetical protein